MVFLWHYKDSFVMFSESNFIYCKYIKKKLYRVTQQVLYFKDDLRRISDNLEAYLEWPREFRGWPRFQGSVRLIEVWLG